MKSHNILERANIDYMWLREFSFSRVCQRTPPQTQRCWVSESLYIIWLLLFIINKVCPSLSTRNTNCKVNNDVSGGNSLHRLQEISGTATSDSDNITDEQQPSALRLVCHKWHLHFAISSLTNNVLSLTKTFEALLKHASSEQTPLLTLSCKLRAWIRKWLHMGFSGEKQILRSVLV